MSSQAARTVQATGLRRPTQTATTAITPTSPSNGWVNPVQGSPRPTGGSLFGAPRTGHSHGGVDLNAAEGNGAGTPIRAAADGTVSWIYSDAGGFGVVIEHTNGWQTKYQHLGTKDSTVKPYAVANGTQVRQGQIIGYMGDTGNPEAGAYHLHFSMLQNGVNVDPMGTGFYDGVVNVDRIDEQVTPESTQTRAANMRSIMTEMLANVSNAAAGGIRKSYQQILDERLAQGGRVPDEQAVS